MTMTKKKAETSVERNEVNNPSFKEKMNYYKWRIKNWWYWSQFL